MRHEENKAGFTLVEMSIVLVVIALIVGGVLVAQQMHEAALIRKTISMVENYNYAVNVFRSRYQGIPGDLATAQSTQFGLQPATPASGAAGRGDGNGIVESCTAGGQGLGCETMLFWQHLSQTGLIPGNFSSVTSGNSYVCACAFTDTATTAYIPTLPFNASPAGNPAARGGALSFVTVYPVQGRNYFSLMTLLSADAVHWGAFYLRAGALSTLQAFQLDSKMDDGTPLGGAIKSLHPFSVGTVSTPGYLDGCILNSTGYPYAVKASPAACNLMIQAAF